MTVRRTIGGTMVAVLLGGTVAAIGQPVIVTAPDPTVRSTILTGQERAPVVVTNPVATVHPGDVSLNFPNADVQAVAKAVLGSMLGLEYTVAPDLHTPVTLVTQRPVSRADVLRLFETSLLTANLALIARNGVYVILPIEQARGQAPVVGAGDSAAFASETIPLKFVASDELRRLIDPVLPNVITSAAPGSLVVAGTGGQRAAVRNLVRQFDVDWLRNTSFALFVPQRTDSRLIVPALDRLINANGAPTKGMVRLVAMDRLNGILAVSTQRQYLDDVQRFVELLDREGESSERRVFVYRVQNGRSADLAKVLANAFGGRGGNSGRSDAPRGGDPLSGPRDDFAIPGGNSGGGAGVGSSGFGNNSSGNGGGAGSGFGSQNGTGSTAQNPLAGGTASSGNSANTTVDINSDDLRARISSDETNNAIVVFATPRDYAVVEDALRKLDVVPYQVMIEAAITEVTLTNALRYGVQWNFNSGRTSSTLSEDPAGAIVRTFPGFSFFYGGSSIMAALNALENLTKINVVSSPKLLVLNNQTAALQVGNQVPIITASSTSTIGSNSPIVNSIEYRDTGIILKITPRVNSSGLVLLDVAQEVSDVVASQTSGINSPTISTRRIATSIAVQDGEVVALGGLISNNTTDTKGGLPFLSHIPVIGGLLFGNTNKQVARTELLVLLRPRVVRTVDDGRALADEMRAKLETLRPLLTRGNGIP
ncbi:type II secretion system secretin GspD [Polymorphobacter sp. PAMC 29334]|uniref:type II secretion system secretin GspD n=1 Tax=Polymorphobacter sp. PAMC 29334 TaxID=2862331 RepID=UPI001C744997|nr:type II secretion system secretin GspD [Polymorphobacter sp. PAMC 29334]QYE33909.1 type II secretion system secretin GspD [Polymorphobacter sp. PAMC 29334]